MLDGLINSPIATAVKGLFGSMCQYLINTKYRQKRIP